MEDIGAMPKGTNTMNTGISKDRMMKALVLMYGKARAQEIWDKDHPPHEFHGARHKHRQCRMKRQDILVVQMDSLARKHLKECMIP